MVSFAVLVDVLLVATTEDADLLTTGRSFLAQEEEQERELRTSSLNVDIFSSAMPRQTLSFFFLHWVTFKNMVSSRYYSYNPHVHKIYF